MARSPHDDGATQRIHVFVGTKAQYIKTAPLLRLLDRDSVAYRLIDSGQHAALGRMMRAELGIREPDLRLGGDDDVTSIAQALTWGAKLGLRLRSGRGLRAHVFGGSGGICLVHGDTPTTLVAALMARRAGLDVAHLEAGLRSHDLFHPFPEELIRMCVSRLSGLAFAPDPKSADRLRRSRARRRVVELSANTSAEALRDALGATPISDDGPAIATMHRVENLRRRSRVTGFLELVARLAESTPVRFVVHGPTRRILDSSGAGVGLRRAGVVVTSIVPHSEFARLLASAPLVVTDGGSIQEECAILGVPTLLWRKRTERSDGLGANVVLSGYDPAVIAAFMDAPKSYRRPPAWPAGAPSQQILEGLRAALNG